jgi:transcriptional regulator with XRE-family HTH domain
MDNLSFGEFIRKERISMGVSMTETAQSIGCNPSYISLLESGREKPAEGLVVKLAEFLEIPLEILKAKAAIVQIKSLKFLSDSEKDRLVSYYITCKNSEKKACVR